MRFTCPLLLLTTLSLAFLRTVNAQATCAPWIGLPTWCSPVLGANYRTSTPYPQVDVASAINSSGLLMNFGAINVSCMESFLNYLCRVSFPPCPMAYPCASTCLAIYSNCPIFVSGSFNCSATSSPCDSTYVKLSDADVCAQPVMVYSVDKGECDFKCPIPLYSHSEYDAMRFFQGISGWVALPLTLFTILSYILIPDFRLRHGLWFSIPALIHILSTLHEVFDFAKVVCPAKTGLDITNYAPCIADGVFSTVGVTAGPLYFSCIAVDLALRLCVNPKASVQRLLDISFVVYSYGITLIAVIVFLAKKNVTTYAFFCSMSGSNERLDNILNTAPIAWACIVGIVAMIIAMVQLSRTGFALGGKDASRAFKYDLKLGLSLLCYLPLPIIIVSEQIWQQQGSPSHITRWSNAFAAWLGCLASGMDKNCKLGDRLSFEILMLIIAASILEFFSPFLLFGIRRKIFRWWFQLFGSLFKMDVPSLKSTFTSGGSGSGEDSSKVLSRRTRNGESNPDL